MAGDAGGCFFNRRLGLSGRAAGQPGFVAARRALGGTTKSAAAGTWRWNRVDPGYAAEFRFAGQPLKA